MPHSSIFSGQPASDVTASTSNRAPASCTICAIPSSGCQAPVDVSAWIRATSLGRVQRASPARTSSGVKTRPHSVSMTTGVPPQRSTTSAMRVPKTPLTPTTTSSPGSTRLTKHVSMPALPVPEMGSVNAFPVWNTCRRRVLVSSIRPMNTGSRWPTSGVDRARSTRGWTLLGPGPRRTRRGVSVSYGAIRVLFDLRDVGQASRKPRNATTPDRAGKAAATKGGASVRNAGHVRRVGRPSP